MIFAKCHVCDKELDEGYVIKASYMYFYDLSYNLNSTEPDLNQLYPFCKDCFEKFKRWMDE